MIVFMYSKHLENKKIVNKKIDVPNKINYCEVSKASDEIMLDRFFNGKEIDFPFTNN